MGAFVTLEQVRVHLNLEPEDLDQDMILRLNQYIAAAFEYVTIKVNAELVENESDIPEEPDHDYRVFSDTMRQAQLMIIDEFFRNRGTSSATLSRETAITVDKILNKRRYFNV